jgi:hypothetical protein
LLLPIGKAEAILLLLSHQSVLGGRYCRGNCGQRSLLRINVRYAIARRFLLIYSISWPIRDQVWLSLALSLPLGWQGEREGYRGSGACALTLVKKLEVFLVIF